MMTSSTRPEIQNLLHRRQTKIEPRLRVTYAENFLKLGNVVFEIRADVQMWVKKLLTISH